MKKVLYSILAVLCFSSFAIAVDSTFITWTGNGSNDLWTNAANWNGTYVSGNYNYPLIDYTGNGNPVVNMDVADVYKGVRMGVYSDEQAILTIASGGHLRMDTDPIVGYLAVGYDTGTSAVCNMTGGQITAHRILMPRAGYGEFNMSGGTISLTDSIRMGESVGHQGGVFNISNGTMNIDSMSVGYGLGTPAVCNISGGTVNTQGFAVGQKGKGICNITGGTLSLERIRIGYDTSGAVGGQGIIDIEGGTIYANTYCAVGFWKTSKPCELNMSGGFLYALDLTIGWHGEGLINLTGGTITVNEADNGGLVRFGGGTSPTGKGGKLNLGGGELKFKGYGIDMFQSSITAGDIVAYNGSGRVLNNYDSGTGYTVIKADPNIAHSPVPDHNASGVNPALTTVQWVNPFVGEIVYCDVWFGTDPTMATATKIVNHQAVSSASVTVNPLGTYYWRVDTYNPVVPSTKYTGVVWKFVTNDMGAQNPQPANNAIDILTSQVLSWSMTGTFDTVKVYTCQGTNPADLTLKSTQSVVDTNYVESLAYNKTYLWRVDAIQGAITTTGAVWKFTTVNPQCLMVGSSGDTNGDCKVNFLDFAELAANWMSCNWDYPDYCGMEEN